MKTIQRLVATSFIASTLLFACSSDDSTTDDTTMGDESGQGTGDGDDGTGNGDNSGGDNDDGTMFDVNSIAIYNHAYYENYDGDKIADIVANAKNAYVLVDPFSTDLTNDIAAMQANGNEVGAYISIGTGENWRDDFDALEPYLATTQWGEWPGEYFISEPTTQVINVMKARIDKIAAWGCDWVEFDNMDWAEDTSNINTYDLEVTEAEGMAYYNTLCDYVIEKGMKCMAKNTVNGAEDFSGVLYESYSDDKSWWDEAGGKSFIDAGKLVIIVHYGESNCDQVYEDYKAIYGDNLSYICEDTNTEAYIHYNE